jgi:peptidoglycan/LPS O-acetylase OafA/YrhL
VGGVTPIRAGGRARILSALSRKTSTGLFIPEIDGLRFICIALVVLFHLNGFVEARSPAAYTVGPHADPVAGFLRHGNWGVHLFFIISGFVLGLPFVSQYQAGGRRVALRAYFARRLTRLEPPYVAAVLLCFGLVAMTRAGRAGVPELLAHLAYVHNLTHGPGSTFITVAWSLEIEVQFYLLAPLLGGLLFSIRHPVVRRGVIAGVGVLAVAGQVAMFRAGLAPPRTLFHFIQFFLAGFLLADVYVTSWKRRPATHAAWDVVWLVGWAGMFAAWRSGSVTVQALGVPAAGLAIFAATFRGVLFRTLLRNPWIVTVGGMCYSIYLLHYPVIAVVGRTSVRWARGGYYGVDLLLQALAVLPVVLLVSTAFFVVVERPCMDRDWPRKVRDRIGSLRRAGRPARSAAENKRLSKIS